MHAIRYMAAADIDHCSENATCHEWEDIKDVVGALLAAELATMIVDILGFCLQAWHGVYGVYGLTVG